MTPEITILIVAAAGLLIALTAWIKSRTQGKAIKKIKKELDNGKK